MKSKLKCVVGGLLCCMLLGIGGAVALGEKSIKSYAEELIMDTQLQEEYMEGDVITLPNATFGGVQADKYLILPDDTLVKTDVYTMTEAGKYTVVYTAIVDGTPQEKRIEVYCYAEKFAMQSTSASLDYVSDYEFPYYAKFEIAKTSADAQTQYENKLAEIEASENFELVQSGENAQGKLTIVYKDKSKFTYSSGLDIDFSIGATLKLGDVVDLTQFDKTKPLLKGYYNAMDEGVVAFRYTVLRLTDVYNPDNYVEIMSYYDNAIYQRARVGGQPSVGLNTAGMINVDNYGTYTPGFYNYDDTHLTIENYSSGDLYKERSFSFYFDYPSSCIYNNQGKLVADLKSTDYFSTPFKGFTTGEVYASLYTDGYVGSKGNLFIASFCGIEGESLGEQELRDTTPPQIEVDLGDYDMYSLPQAIVGKNYTLFPAATRDLLSGCKKLQAKVWYNYYSANPINVSVENGSFIPRYAGDYVIEYLASDYMGNVGVQTIPVKAVTSIGAGLDVELTIPTQTGYIANKIPVAPYVVKNSSGATTISITACCGDETLTIDNTELLLQVGNAGTWTIKYEVIDFAGQRVVKTYDIVITADTAPVFIDDIVLPKYILEGFDNPLPALSAYDYRNNGVEVQAVVSVEAEGKQTLTLDGYSFKPDSSYVGKTLKFVYTATTETGTSFKEYYADCVSTIVDGNSNKIEKKELFVQSSGVTSTYAAMTTNTKYAHYTMLEGSTLEYVNSLPAHNFSFIFYVIENGMNKVNVYLTDSDDAAKEVKISFIKHEGYTSVSINGSVEYKLSNDVLGEAVATEVAFDNLRSAVQLDNKNFNYTVDTKTVFSSNKLYFRVETEGVNEECVIAVEKVCNQTLTDSNKDNVSPFGVITGEYEILYNLNDVVEILPFVASDAVNPNIALNFSVTYDGEFVQDVNGRVLDNVPIEEGILVKLSNYGTYTVSYNILGYFSMDIGLEVFDYTPPTVSFVSALGNKYTVGDSIELKASAVDNSVDSIVANILVKNAMGVYTYVGNGSSYTFTKAGHYTVYAFAYDENGNYGCIEKTITVEAK